MVVSGYSEFGFKDPDPKVFGFRAVSRVEGQYRIIAGSSFKVFMRVHPGFIRLSKEPCCVGGVPF